jgi:hypothetical protein
MTVYAIATNNRASSFALAMAWEQSASLSSPAGISTVMIMAAIGPSK